MVFMPCSGSYFSDDLGKTANFMSQDINRPDELPLTTYSALQKIGDDLYIGSRDDGEIYKSSDKGKTWDLFSKSSSHTWVKSIYANQDDIYVGTYTSLFKSSIQNISWTEIINGISGYPIVDMLEHNDSLYLATQNGIRLSHFNSFSWNKT